MLLIPFDRERTLNTMFTALMMTPVEREFALQHAFNRKAWLEHFRDCDVLGFRIDGEIAGGAVFRGMHLHIAVLPHYRSRWFPLFRKVVEYGFRKYGNPLIARVNARNARALTFVQQIGGAEQSRDDISVTFWLTPEAMRYRKRG